MTTFPPKDCYESQGPLLAQGFIGYSSFLSSFSFQFGWNQVWWRFSYGRGEDANGLRGGRASMREGSGEGLGGPDSTPSGMNERAANVGGAG